LQENLWWQLQHQKHQHEWGVNGGQMKGSKGCRNALVPTSVLF
jgi:hypothetical protein